MKILKTLSVTLLIIGFLLILLGLLSKIQHWPDICRGMYTGPIIMIIGAILFLVRLLRK